MKLTRKEIVERRDSLLIELQIMRVANQKGYTLSGGERRRCEIARALATNPDFILLDEPFAGVDPIAVKDIQTVIQSLRERGLGILITDHNVRETLKITDRAYIMYSGKILISGTADDLINDPETRRIYLGEDFTL
jgi:lipopolysaccharide export system ATP-binding protein